MDLAHGSWAETPEDRQDIGFRGSGHRRRHLGSDYHYKNLRSTINILVCVAIPEETYCGGILHA